MGPMLDIYLLTLKLEPFVQARSHCIIAHRMPHIKPCIWHAARHVN
jgi:hypothetical protein